MAFHCRCSQLLPAWKDGAKPKKIHQQTAAQSRIFYTKRHQSPCGHPFPWEAWHNSLEHRGISGTTLSLWVTFDVIPWAYVK